MPKRVLITVARESSGEGWRIAIEVRTLLAGAMALLGVAFVFVTGASWTAKQVVGDLLRQNAGLRMENASYRDATSELVAQVSALQSAADDLGARAALDPAAAGAIQRLPSSITRRAMGGGGGATLSDISAPIASVVSSADPAFGVLRDILHLVERKLNEVRPGVEQREALAAATPSIWPVAGWLSSAYGNRRDPFTGAPDFHSGLDISADRGEPVRASADGVVVTARGSGNFGNLVTLDHGFGIATRYGHLARFAVSEGQRVRKGDVVGYVGATGRATSPHLHYELLLNGATTNPLRLLGRRSP
jgi:murein DD-endopeptidase MepM/ murein hydrolase activator NlpD